MQGRGHLGLGLLAYAPIGFILLKLELFVAFGLGAAGIVFWSHMPDVDLQVPFLSHRGLTHTYLAAVFAGLLTAGVSVGMVVAGLEQPGLRTVLGGATVGFLVGTLGILSHLAGDVITPMGIEPKRPFDDSTYTFDLVYASDKRANIGFATLGTSALVGSMVLAGI